MSREFANGVRVGVSGSLEHLETLFADDRAWVKDRHYFADAAWAHRLGAAWSARFRVGFDSYKYTGSYRYSDAF
jgi:hypothetical protein